MVNDADVDLIREENPNYEFKNDDKVTFISMVHGG